MPKYWSEGPIPTLENGLASTAIHSYPVNHVAKRGTAQGYDAARTQIKGQGLSTSYCCRLGFIMGQLTSFVTSVYLNVVAHLIHLSRTVTSPSCEEEKAPRQLHSQETLSDSCAPQTQTSTSALVRPLPNSYWATPFLLACEYPWTPRSSDKLDALLNAGVRTFIDLTQHGELRPYFGQVLTSRAKLQGIDHQEIEYHRFPIHDRCLPQSIEFIHSVMGVLRDNERRNRITVVHCRGGIGRTGMVIGCWLIQSSRVKDGAEALDIIAREWKTVEKCNRFPHSPETGPQFDFVLHFQAAPKPVSAIS